MKISDRIYYVGVNDVIKELFEGLWPLPFGVSYNSYLVVDDKVALVDTVEAGFEDEFLEEIEASIGDRPIDYLIVNHMEPDHSSLTAYMLEKYPSMKIVANAKTLPMLKGYYGVSEDRVHVVGEAQTLSLGGCTLRFHIGAVNEQITDSEETFGIYRDEMIRYYSNIVGKYGTPVQAALKKLAGVRIDRICSTHGPVWEECVDQVIALYDKMSRYEVERGVCLVYGSMYGNTAAAADALAEELEARGIPYAIHDLAGNNEDSLGVSGALRDVFKYDTVVVGSPTYNGAVYPPVETFMKALAARNITNRRFFAFGSYTWAQASVRLLNAAAQDLGFTLLGDGMPFPHAYTQEKCDMAALAELLK